MKINFLFPVVSSAVLDDTSTLLSVATQSAKAMNLMNAVGHRNVTTMQALVQEIADESVSEPGWKFDDDIKAALKAIKDMFVKSIQVSLVDEHKNDQEHFNCFTQECFGACNSGLDADVESCKKIGEQCVDFGKQHAECREVVYSTYKDMAKKCAQLHCFEIPDPVCRTEDCLCPDLNYCHRKGGDSECVARAGECKGAFGNFLQQQITKYKSAFAEWQALHSACKVAYHGFLKVDLECDNTQKEFESCSCKKSRCDYTSCGVDFAQCTEQCWGRYYELVKEKECLEKDRKIDWSATKKIECYVDVLLHDYTQEELLTKCGTNDCINKAREEDYKHCAKVCPQIDYDGDWPSVLSVDPGNVKIKGHALRSHKSQYLLGDEKFKCDFNGDEVFTKHRGGVDREDEYRCTEHLDFDFQIPECVTPECEKVPVCDAAFHKEHYSKYDEISKIGCISECCPDDGKATCFNDVTLKSSSDGKKLTTITVSEHSNAWAYNRCECTECQGGFPEYTTPPENHQCGAGAHGRSTLKACPKVMCMLHCENGRQTDENGCDMCKCAAALKYTVNGQEYESREAQTGGLVWKDRSYKFIGDIHELEGATFFFQPHKSLPAGSTWRIENIPVGSEVFVASELTQHARRSGGFHFDDSWTHLHDQRVRWNAVQESVDLHVTKATSSEMTMSTNKAWVGFVAVKKQEELEAPENPLVKGRKKKHL